MATKRGSAKPRGQAAKEAIQTTIRYVESVFGAGTGPSHVAFLDRLQNDGLRDVVHHCHALEADTTHVSLEENYLIGMCVLAALGNRGTAAMFAKVLLCLGTPKIKILEAAGRLSMWMGALPAAEVSFVVQRAIADYEKSGFASLSAWFPELQVRQLGSTPACRSSSNERPASGEVRQTKPQRTTKKRARNGRAAPVRRGAFP